MWPTPDPHGAFATYHRSMPLQPDLIGLPLHFHWIRGTPTSVSWSNGATLLPFAF